MKKSNHRVTIVNRLERRVISKPLTVAVMATLQLFGTSDAHVVVALADSTELRRLNLEFRGVDRSTDVLAFPSPERFSQTLGDVVLNWDMAVQQAKRREVRTIDEAAMLAVHGTLHLLGFDDHNHHDLAQMRRAMNQVMRHAGLPEEENWESLPYPQERDV